MGVNGGEGWKKKAPKITAIMKIFVAVINYETISLTLATYFWLKSVYKSRVDMKLEWIAGSWPCYIYDHINKNAV